MRLSGVLFLTLFSLALICVVIWRLEVNGWGSLVWTASTIVLMVIRMPYAWRTKENRITEKKSVSSERLLLALVAVGMMYLPLVHLASGALSFADFDPPYWVVWAGSGILVPAYWLFWRSHADLDRNWSATTELRAEHELVTTGVYRSVRHPMYAAIWLIVAAQPLLIHNWIAGPAGLLAFAVMYFVRVPNEESMMREHFGAAYDEYCKRSGRLWPRHGSV